MLNAKSVAALKAKSSQYKTADKDGLYILTRTNGNRLWQYKYRFAGKEKVYSYGQYPAVSLSEARQAHEVIRKKVRDGIDPVADKQAGKAGLKEKHKHTFEIVAKEWLNWAAKSAPKGPWMPAHKDKVWHDIVRDLIPTLGNLPVADIKTPILLKVLKGIEARGAVEVASRSQQRLVGILNCAIQHGYIEHNVAISLKGVIAKPAETHRAAVGEDDTREIGELVRRINGYAEFCCGSILTELALKLTLYTFLRSVEIRGARWSEFNFELSEWTVPAMRDAVKMNGGMKARKVHIVPLSTQALAVLAEIRALDLSNDLVFPIQSGSKRIMSENTMNHALNAMGYKGLQTVHGLRTIASTLLNAAAKKQGWSRDAIERQLAHSPKSDDATRDAYNRYDYIDERVPMMQWYANRIDDLANGAQVLTLRRVAS